MLSLNGIKHFSYYHFSGYRFYRHLQAAYHTVFNRELVRLQSARETFYRQLISPGNLVFDVGANIGQYSNMFLRLGARVVAAEPNPWCCKRIDAIGHKDRLTLKRAAVGDAPGVVRLFVGDYDGHSTASTEWMEQAAKNDPGFKWKGSIDAKMTTLDEMRQEYGVPDFIKIDVEGFEISVLRGMSFRPGALCFEFHTFAPEAFKECLLLPIFQTGCSFNISLGDDWKFIWPEWRDQNAVLAYTAQLPSDVFGDVYVRFGRTD